MRLPIHSKQRLAATKHMAKRLAAAEAKRQRSKGPPEAGDIFLNRICPEAPVEWLVTENDGGLLRLLPIDDFPLVGSRDWQLSNEVLGGFAVVRCHLDTWVGSPSMEIGRRTNTLQRRDLEAVLERRAAALEGAPHSNLEGLEVDSDPEYCRWIDVTLPNLIDRLRRVPLSEAAVGPSRQRAKEVLGQAKGKDNERALEVLGSVAREPLLAIARALFTEDGDSQQLQPMEAVESFLSDLPPTTIARWENWQDLLAGATRYMRRLLVQQARQLRAVTKGENAPVISFGHGTLLETLKSGFLSPRQERLVKMLGRSGLTLEESAFIEGVAISVASEELIDASCRTEFQLILNSTVQAKRQRELRSMGSVERKKKA